MELEKGEDYDVIKQTLGGAETERELAQIKYRDTNFTLNAETVLECIFNFYQHRLTNPEYRLIFRLITNTSYSIERPAIFPESKAGIEAWNELLANDKWDNTDKRFETIRAHLQKKFIGLRDDIKDDKSALKVQYDGIVTFLQADNHEKIIPFIKSFYWGANSKDIEEISEAIKSKLTVYNVDTEQADTIYARLFLYVFKILSHKGDKYLDRAMLLQQLTLPVLSADDEQALKGVLALIESLGSRVKKMEDALQGQARDINKLFAQVGNIEKLDATFEYHRQSFSVSPPLLIPNGSDRTEKVATITNKFATYTWIAFTGINGTGKSQLAALVSERFEQCYWLDLRAYRSEEAKANLLLEQFLVYISQKEVNREKQNWISDVVDNIPPNSILIINDLPRTTSGSIFSQLLVLLANSAALRGIKIVTTSNFPIHHTIQASLDAGVWGAFEDFEFTNGEIQEYFDKNALTGYDSYIGIVAEITRRNPRLVTAIVQFLLKHAPGDKFISLLQSEFSREVLDDAQQSIRTYISNDDTKTLLYRLSLVNWDFGSDLVQHVSGVNPVVRFPNEKLNELLNIWVQQNQESYSVSPMIYDIGKQNLTPTELTDTYEKIAESVLAKKTLDNITASRAITAYHNAKNFDKAGLILITIYQSVKSKEDAIYLKDWGYFSYWKDMSLPAAMNLNIRSFIRSEQRRIAFLLGEDTSYFETQLQNYLEEQGIGTREKVLISISSLSSFNVLDTLFLDRLQFVVDNWAALDMPGMEKVDKTVLGYLAWVPIYHVNTVEKASRWLEIIQKIKILTGVDAFTFDVAPSAISVIANRLVANEDKTPQAARNWMAVLDTLTNLHEYLVNDNKELLSAIVLREILTIKHRALGEQAEALAMAEKAITGYTIPRAVFRVADIVGRLYYYENPDISLDYFSIAIRTQCKEDLHYSESIVYAASIYSKNNPNIAVQLCIQAKEIVVVNLDFSEIDYLPYLAELGIAYWLAEDYTKSFECFNELVEKLFELQNGTDNYWKKIFKLSGHVLGFISLHIARGEKLNIVQDENYVEPFVGMLVTNNRDFGDLFEDNKSHLVMVQMALFAEGIGDLDIASRWATAAFDRVRQFADIKSTVQAATICSIYTLIDKKYTESFEQYLFAVLAYSAVRKMGVKAYEAMTNDEFSELQANKSNEYWRIAESDLIDKMIIPTLISLCLDSIDDGKIDESNAQKLLKVVEVYSHEAGNPENWLMLHSLLKIVVSNESTEAQLNELASQYKQENKTQFQLLFLIRLACISDNPLFIVNQLLNILPYIITESGNIELLNKHIIIPFAKKKVTLAIKKFLDHSAHASILASQIDILDHKAPKVIQKILQIAITALNITVPEDRKEWLG
ncbi:MAG: hypothetical protein ACK4EY_03330 [Flavipsychrobacter sp.]